MTRRLPVLTLVVLLWVCVPVVFLFVAGDTVRLSLSHVHLVHRHGDRTPITPLRDEAFWRSTLPGEAVLDNLAQGTIVLRDDDNSTNDTTKQHGAAGRGPFGRLTMLGLLHMVELGGRLREDLTRDDEETVEQHGRKLLLRYRPLLPDDGAVAVTSTDFSRTIQSAQALLVGLLPDHADTKIEIDARHTDIMIPDPQPRRTPEQAELESELTHRSELQAREQRLRPLAVRVTENLAQSFLAEDYRRVSFGIGEEDRSSSDAHLPWAQLAEVTKCLSVRGLLTDDVCTEEEREIISHEVAYRWFDLLSHDRLIHLAIGPMVQRLLRSCTNNNHHDTPLHLYSAHDSTLIALLCALRLRRPAQWPAYGSWLKIEVWTDDDDEVRRYVRCSLNGETLLCDTGSATTTTGNSTTTTDDDNTGLLELIPLDTLKQLVRYDDAAVE